MIKDKYKFEDVSGFHKSRGPEISHRLLESTVNLFTVL
jgi:hypothetical protein